MGASMVRGKGVGRCATKQAAPWVTGSCVAAPDGLGTTRISEDSSTPPDCAVGVFEVSAFSWEPTFSQLDDCSGAGFGRTDGACLSSDNVSGPGTRHGVPEGVASSQLALAPAHRPQPAQHQAPHLPGRSGGEVSQFTCPSKQMGVAFPSNGIGVTSSLRKSAFWGASCQMCRSGLAQGGLRQCTHERRD